MTEADIYTYGIPLIILLIISEIIYSHVYKLKYYKSKDSAAAFGLLLGNYAVNLGTKGSILVLYFYLYNYLVYQLSLNFFLIENMIYNLGY